MLKAAANGVAGLRDPITQEPGGAEHTKPADLLPPPEKTVIPGQEVDLRSLVSHQYWLAGDVCLEKAHEFFCSHDLEFVAVLEAGRLLGICARRQVGLALGARFGFSLFSRSPVREYLLPRALVFRTTDSIRYILEQVSLRPGEHFYDDVLLVDEPGTFIGSVLVRTLVRVQHSLLLDNLRQLENRRAEIERQNRQMEQELIMAGRVQQAMLPQVYPVLSSSLPGGGEDVLRFEHRYLPAGKVSGDFFHVRRISEQLAGVFMCDVMGHGVRSAMITGTMRALVEELHSEAGQPGAVLEQLNRDLHAILNHNDETMYASAIYLTIDMSDRRICWATAGHPCPLLLRRDDGAVTLMKPPGGKPGKVLGLFERGVYETGEAILQIGDRLLLYTDGVYEIFCGDREFGLEGFTAALQQFSAFPLGSWLDQTMEIARAFGETRNFEDDVCLLAMEIPDPKVDDK